MPHVRFLPIDLTYFLRSGEPDAYDKHMAIYYANVAMSLVEQGTHGLMAGHRNGRYIATDIPGKNWPARRVNPQRLPRLALSPTLRAYHRRVPTTGIRGYSWHPNPRKGISRIPARYCRFRTGNTGWLQSAYRHSGCPARTAIDFEHDLGLSYTETGVLTALPILVLGCFAWPSGLLIGRIGGRRCVTIGLILLSLGTFLRVLWPSTISLYCFTILLSLGITIAQTAVPVLARRWFPRHIGMVAALFSDGLIIGEAIGAGITVPIMGQFLGNDAWAETFVVWTIPIVIVLVLWFLFAPPEYIHHEIPGTVGTDLSRPPRPHADLQPTMNADDAQNVDGRVVEGGGRDKSALQSQRRHV